MKNLLIILIMLSSCTAAKVTGPGMYEVTSIEKIQPGETKVKFNNSKRWYKIYSDSKSDTLKVKDSIYLNVVQVMKY